MKKNRSSKRHLDRGYLWERTQHDELEAAFANRWEQMAEFSHNRHLMDVIMDEEVSDRDRYVAATVVQWLGTNCGFAFMLGALADCGYSIDGTMPRNSEPLLQALKIVEASEKAKGKNYEMLAKLTKATIQPLPPLQSSRRTPRVNQQRDFLSAFAMPPSPHR